MLSLILKQILFFKFVNVFTNSLYVSFLCVFLDNEKKSAKKKPLAMALPSICKDIQEIYLCVAEKQHMRYASSLYPRIIYYLRAIQQW